MSRGQSWGTKQKFIGYQAQPPFWAQRALRNTPQPNTPLFPRRCHHSRDMVTAPLLASSLEDSLTITRQLYGRPRGLNSNLVQESSLKWTGETLLRGSLQLLLDCWNPSLSS